MQHFILSGTSATIVSNRVSWLASNSELIEILKSKAQAGIRIEIITPHPLPDELRNALTNVSLIVTKEANPPEARFTLINGDRSGAERLAIARGVHPEHEITNSDNNSGPQIIAMARDMIRKSKASRMPHRWSNSAELRRKQIESGRDITFNHVFAPTDLVDRLSDLSPHSVIEIGAGTGHLSRALSDSGFSVTAIEPSPECLPLRRRLSTPR